MDARGSVMLGSSETPKRAQNALAPCVVWGSSGGLALLTLMERAFSVPICLLVQTLLHLEIPSTQTRARGLAGQDTIRTAQALALGVPTW